jgi:capsular polysaccharide biosynthesis protein
MREITAQSGGIFEERGQPECVRYALPLSASAELREFFRGQTEINFPPPFLATLPGGRVFGAGNVLSPDGKTIARDVSPDFGKAFGEHWLLTYPKIPPPLNLPGRTAVVATTLASGYGHWLLEELPRLLEFAGVRQSDALIVHVATSYAREAMARAGFTGKVMTVKRGAHFACEELIVPSLGRPSPLTVRAINEFADSMAREDVNVGEKFYISRAHARRRKVVNEVELWAALESHGFVQIQLENLSWAQQIAAFRSAKVIVAPHGAGLANLVFSQPGTRVVELFHRSYVNGCYWQIAALREIDYRPLVSAGDEPLAQRPSANRLDIQADVAAVVRAAVGE